MAANATGTWLDLIMLKSLKKGKFVYPGNPKIAHAWAYLPDLARAAVGIVEARRELGAFSDISFAGYTVTGTQMLKALEAASGRDLKLSRMPWWPLKLASPFWPLGRELLEMRYLWDHPHGLDGTALSKILPEFEATEFEVAMASLLPLDIEPNQSVVRTERFA
jgi:nucleoside-diphosphate-sugar epimerase